MNYTFYKKLENNKLKHIWLKLIEKENIKLLPFKCESEYYGEGLKEEDLIPIDKQEFENLHWLFNCEYTNELEKILFPSN
jgi:hypothetical protein